MRRCLSRLVYIALSDILTRQYDPNPGAHVMTSLEAQEEIYSVILNQIELFKRKVAILENEDALGQYLEPVLDALTE